MSNAFFAKPLPIAAASGPAAFGDLIYLANDYMGVAWGASAGQMYASGGNWYFTLIFDLGSDQPVDTMLLLGLNGEVPATAQVKLTVHSEASVYYVSPAFAAHAGT